MILKSFVASLMVLRTLGESVPSDVPLAEQYLFGFEKFFPSFNWISLFDGPSSVSGAPITTPIRITQPTREEIIYYNYYTDAVYCPFEIKTLECVYCYKIRDDITEFVVLENTTHDTFALVALSKRREEIVVALRGSENFWNYVLDAYLINTSPEGANQVKIHRGFYIATMSLYDRIVKTIKAFRLSKEEYKSYKLVITGHSLGGAMARILEFLLLNVNQFPYVSMEVYTYGEPRNGNKYYVDYLNSQNVKTARITHRADIVPHFPPTALFGTIFYDYYYHVLNEYWIDDSGEKFADQSIYEDPTASNSLGPLYSPIEHEKYFDVNHLRCLLTDAHEFLAIPVIFNPPDVLPPFPKPIRDSLSEFADIVISLTRPFG